MFTENLLIYSLFTVGFIQSEYGTHGKMSRNELFNPN